ncbi:DUF1206 domain-containing protein [Rossellomorea aquimaris]|uniref:DUF1206 domain-containing protein n=1 Tax=Rossellomorea aquimaris TaxID=189382 RepID=UPI001CD5170D|nr:DUF1206 domain-containing protein [Rossellomorea aquimaris]MCA1055347.1 DUF1206 domain-containing protein [Rossellomorea aquimaris]
MADFSSIASQVTSSKSSSKGEDIKPWIRGFARVGYIARGSVYMMIGALALMAAFGVGGSMSDSSGAFRAVAQAPFGEVLLWIVGFSLIGIVLWSFIEVVKDPGHSGSSKVKSTFRRLSHLFSGIAYAVLSYNAFMIAMHAKSGSGSGKQTMSAKLLSQPFGQWIVGIVGAVIIGYALYEIHKGYSEKYTKYFKRHKMSDKEWQLGKKAGKLGLYSRGLVFLLVGYFFIQTAITADPDQTKGLDGALSKIAQQPFGQWILAIVAAGLFLYGVYQILKGKNRHLSMY